MRIRHALKPPLSPRCNTAADGAATAEKKSGTWEGENVLQVIRQEEDSLCTGFVDSFGGTVQPACLA